MKYSKRYAKLVIRNSSDSKQRTLKSSNGNGLAIDCTQNIAVNGKSNSADITMYNIGATTKRYLKSKNTVVFYAGYVDADTGENDIRAVVRGEIKTVGQTTKGSIDRPITFSVIEGKDYEDAKKVAKTKEKKTKIKENRHMMKVSKLNKAHTASNKKTFNDWLKKNPKVSTHRKSLARKAMEDSNKKYHSALEVKYKKQKDYYTKNQKYKKTTVYKSYTFKKGTKASAIIRFMATKANIPIAVLKLNKDSVYKKGYKASKNALSTIKAVAKHCHTDIWQNNGKLYIARLDNYNDTKQIVNYSSGLLAEPEINDDGKTSGYNITTIAYPWIKVGAIFTLKSQTHSAKMIIYGAQIEYFHDHFSAVSQAMDLVDYKKSVKDGKLVSFDS